MVSAKHRVRKWLVVVCLVLIPAAGFLAARVIQPERFARDDGCVDLRGADLVNACSRPIIVEACMAEDDGISRCALIAIDSGAAVVRPETLGEGVLRLAACHAPFIPARIASPLNLSLLINGCRKPDPD